MGEVCKVGMCSPLRAPASGGAHFGNLLRLKALCWKHASKISPSVSCFSSAPSRVLLHHNLPEVFLRGDISLPWKKQPLLTARQPLADARARHHPRLLLRLPPRLCLGSSGMEPPSGLQEQPSLFAPTPHLLLFVDSLRDSVASVCLNSTWNPPEVSVGCHC